MHRKKRNLLDKKVLHHNSVLVQGQYIADFRNVVIFNFVSGRRIFVYSAAKNQHTGKNKKCIFVEMSLCHDETRKYGDENVLENEGDTKTSKYAIFTYVFLEKINWMNSQEKHISI